MPAWLGWLIGPIISWVLSKLFGKGREKKNEEVKDEQIEAEWRRPRSNRDLADRMRDGDF